MYLRERPLNLKGGGGISGGFRGGGRPPHPPKIRKEYVIQR